MTQSTKHTKILEDQKYNMKCTNNTRTAIHYTICIYLKAQNEITNIVDLVIITANHTCRMVRHWPLVKFSLKLVVGNS